MERKLWLDKPEDGSQTEVGQLKGCHFLDLEISSPQPTTTYQQMEGADGSKDMGTTYGPRTLSASFLIEGDDVFSFQQLQREVWLLFLSREAYYVRCSDNPGMRWLVHAKPFEYSVLDMLNKTFTVELEAFQGFAESVGTTLDPFTFDSELWQNGQGLLGEDFQYQFSKNKFSVYNAGDLLVDPREHELLITIEGQSEGATRIHNKTTGDVFVYKPVLLGTDVLTIDGPYPKINGLHCGRSTDHGLIRLAPGWNDIEIHNAIGLQVSFLFRFLYH